MTAFGLILMILGITLFVTILYGLTYPKPDAKGIVRFFFIGFGYVSLFTIAGFIFFYGLWILLGG